MTTMIEQMAKKIYALRISGFMHGPKFEDLPTGFSGAIIWEAEEALKALLDPTEAMKEAGRKCVRDYFDDIEPLMPTDIGSIIFRAMIQAALNEAQKKP